jgi:hypothetical protein
MTNDEFKCLVGARIDHCHMVLLSKQKEYATEDDPFHNFRAAALQSTTYSAIYDV